ncbi:MAG: nucleotide exchange factor GrpE [Chloroflexota bacterium]|nr:nucleotide exchange factor GrpE [Chloroflexota bacterium]
MTTGAETSSVAPADRPAADLPGTDVPGTDVPGTGAPAAGGQGAEARELERQLDELRQKARDAETRAQENLDRWQRAQADLANYRRRAQFEREELEKFAAASLVAALLPVLDNFDRAWGSLPGQFRRLTWLSGVAMIHSQLRGTLERVGLVEIEAQDKPFDPALHEAVEHEAGDGTPHVIAVLQAGYKLHERVVRPTLVKVGPKAGVSPVGITDDAMGATPDAEAQPDATPGTASE